jgi:hypothetical protein
MQVLFKKVRENWLNLEDLSLKKDLKWRELNIGIDFLYGQSHNINTI